MSLQCLQIFSYLELNITVSVLAGEEALPGQRRSLRGSNIRNLKDASSSDEDGEDSGMYLSFF